MSESSPMQEQTEGDDASATQFVDRLQLQRFLTQSLERIQQSHTERMASLRAEQAKLLQLNEQ